MPTQVNPAPSEVKETTVVGTVRLTEIPFKVKVPVFEEVKVDKPTFVDRKIEVPTGWDSVINELSLEIANKIMDRVEIVLGARLDKAIDKRIKEIESPKIVEKLVVNEKVVDVERPNYKDVTIERPVYVDREVINPVTKDVEVINAVIADRTVINAVITDQKITNAIIKDVEVERAIIREKVIDVIHPRYLKFPSGEPE
jgi:hypothetical protein